MYKYLEIIEGETKEVVSRIDVTTKSENQIEQIERGAMINMNCDKFSIVENESEIELPKIR